MSAGKFLHIVCVCVIGVGMASRIAQSAQTDNAEQRLKDAKSLWDVEQMLEEHVERLTRHYNLNPQQQAQTSKLLADRVHTFLDKHDRDIWPLMLDLVELNNNGQNVDALLAKRVATKGYHIFLDAKQEILKGQDVFREYLGEDQQKIHDHDLKGLDYHFTQWENQFKSYRQGNTAGKPPLHNVRLGGGQPLIPRSSGKLSTSRLVTEARWDKFVRQYIKDYQLDEEQKTRALVVLNEMKDRAGKYGIANKKDLDDAQRDLFAAQRAKPFDPGALKQAQVIWKLLNRPFDDMFAELKARLDQIPTEKQKADYFKRFPERKPAKTVAIPIEPKKTEKKSDGDKKPQPSETVPAPEPQNKNKG